MPQMKPTYWLMIYTFILLIYMLTMSMIYTFMPTLILYNPQSHSLLAPKWTWQW